MKLARPKYRLCWSCNQPIYRNHHRVVRVQGGVAYVHVACAKQDDLEVNVGAHNEPEGSH